MGRILTLAQSASGLPANMAPHGERSGTLSSSIIALSDTHPDRSVYLHAEGKPCQRAYRDVSGLFRGKILCRRSWSLHRYVADADRHRPGRKCCSKKGQAISYPRRALLLVTVIAPMERRRGEKNLQEPLPGLVDMRILYIIAL